MAQFFYAYLSAFGVMTILDAVWLGFIAPGFYNKHLGFLMSDKPNWIAAIAFYLIYILGVSTFIVYPGWKNIKSTLKVGLLGALFGLVAYATYDLSNQATIKNWPLIVTFVDLLWGTILTSVVCIVAVLILKFLNK